MSKGSSLLSAEAAVSAELPNAAIWFAAVEEDLRPDLAAEDGFRGDLALPDVSEGCCPNLNMASGWRTGDAAVLCLCLARPQPR